MKDIIVYTCIIGDYDNYISFPKNLKEEGVDYIYITDNNKIKVEGYQMLYVDKIDNDNKITNRYYKLKMNKLLKNYKYSIYYDGNVEVLNKLKPLLKYVENHDIAMFDYFIFMNVYEQFLGKYSITGTSRQEILNKRYKEYINDGWKDNQVNPNGKFIIRKHNEKLYDFMNDWYEDTKIIGRDEFTFHYNRWKHNINFNLVFSVNLFHYFTIYWHRYENGKHAGFNQFISPTKFKKISRITKLKIGDYFMRIFQTFIYYFYLLIIFFKEKFSV